MDGHPNPSAIRVIAPCLGKRFSGINASMIAVLPELNRAVPIAALGFHIPPHVPRIGFRQFLGLRLCGAWRIWHARRNMDMLVGLVLRRILRFKILLVFTSAAQRPHSWITRWYVHRMDALICPTAAAASFLDRPAQVVSHGVNTRVFHPPADRSAEWAARGLPGRYGIGVFGRLRPQKGTQEFVEAMIRVLPQRPGWTAFLVGHTTKEFLPFERRMRARLSQAGLDDRVVFTGFLKDPQDVPAWYRAMSVVVCPSRVEGFGLPCLEAMASGCPVVATRTGAWPELIREGEDGYLVPCQDVSALADAILKVTADPARLDPMGRSAREKVASRYRIEDEAAGILAVYEHLFARHGTAMTQENGGEPSDGRTVNGTTVRG